MVLSTAIAWSSAARAKDLPPQGQLADGDYIAGTGEGIDYTGTLAYYLDEVETIRTKSFEIKIACYHEKKGDTSCNRLTYIGKSLKTGKSITLTGNAVYKVGYEFHNGMYTYSVSKYNVLTIYKGERLILREEGTSINN